MTYGAAGDCSTYASGVETEKCGMIGVLLVRYCRMVNPQYCQELLHGAQLISVPHYIAVAAVYIA